MKASVILESWGDGDLPLLERLTGDPRMTEHLSPEPESDSRDAAHAKQESVADPGYDTAHSDSK